MSRNRSWILWGVGSLLALLWVGTVLAYVDSYLNRAAVRDFRREGRRYLELWADRVAEQSGNPTRQERLVRRLSGELDSWGAGTVTPDGNWLVRVGPPVDLPFFPSLSTINDRRLDETVWLFRAPLWVDGRRAGDLVWVRSCATLRTQAQRRRRGLFAAWMWWAVAGGIGVALAIRTGQRDVFDVNTVDAANDSTPRR